MDTNRPSDCLGRRLDWPRRGSRATRPFQDRRKFNLQRRQTGLESIASAPLNIDRHMYARLAQLARHLSRPLPNYAHNSAAATVNRAFASPIMATERNKRMIHTAGCIIIGDEVLGGKVRIRLPITGPLRVQHAADMARCTPDCRHQLGLPRQILLLTRHHAQAHRGHCRRRG